MNIQNPTFKLLSNNKNELRFYQGFIIFYIYQIETKLSI